MAKNKRNALSVIQNNVVASSSPCKKSKTVGRRAASTNSTNPSTSSITNPNDNTTKAASTIVRSKRISSKARASDVYEGSNKNRVQYVSQLSLRVPLFYLPILHDIINTLIYFRFWSFIYIRYKF
jgi:hypothetical protein